MHSSGETLISTPCPTPKVNALAAGQGAGPLLHEDEEVFKVEDVEGDRKRRAACARLASRDPAALETPIRLCFNFRVLLGIV